MTTPNTQKQTIIYLPNVYRCVNGTEFEGGGKPERCPVCGSTEIEEVRETEVFWRTVTEADGGRE